MSCVYNWNVVWEIVLMRGPCERQGSLFGNCFSQSHVIRTSINGTGHWKLKPSEEKNEPRCCKNWFAINTTTSAWWTAASLRKLSASRCQDINIYQNKMTACHVGRHRTVEELQDTHSDTLSVDLVLTDYALWSLRNLAHRIKCSTCEWHKFHRSIWGRLPVGRQPVMFKWTLPNLVWVRLKDLPEKDLLLMLPFFETVVSFCWSCFLLQHPRSFLRRPQLVKSLLLLLAFFACCCSWLAFKGSLLMLSYFDPTYNEVDGRF